MILVAKSLSVSERVCISCFVFVHGVRSVIFTDPGKTEVISRWSVPKNEKNHRQFLGLASYYRRFVPGFASIAAPLNNLLKGLRCVS